MVQAKYLNGTCEARFAVNKRSVSATIPKPQKKAKHYITTKWHWIWEIREACLFLPNMIKYKACQVYGRVTKVPIIMPIEAVNMKS